MAKVFEGVRVVDFTQVISGPYASYQLALQGADVIKLEHHQGGDQGRAMMAGGPDFLDAGQSSLFMAFNSNKRSLGLDLKHPGARDVVRRLVESADVVVENFKAGTLARMGFGYDTISEWKPNIVYCSISGFGATGPLAGKAAYDPVIQAHSGMMTLTGFPENGPTKVGFWVTDVAAGIHAAYAISSALFARERTGQGRRIDLSMLDAAIGFISPMVLHYLNCGIEPQLAGNGSAASSNAPTVYPTATNMIQIATATQAQYEKMCDVLERPDLKTDPRFAERLTRMDNGPALFEELSRTFATRPAKEWEKKLEAVGVPAGVVNTVPEMLRDEQVIHRHVVQTVDPPVGLAKSMAMINAAFHLNEGSPSVVSPPPHVGQHTDQVLGEVGFSSADIAKLREDRVVG
ncbi:MAG: CoA transferase [Alphaproteobacteria bacterium]|nr:CoA transferase [Alphaproteobacteria bacterium]MCB9929374.1 CoA transferase [Alphaproteobacteria bacterium]